VGVTATQITVGNVATLTGPIPGLFQGSPYAVEAYFNYINTTQGGVNGRKLVVKGGDDALTCSGNQTATQDLEPQVFAFVGTFTVLDSCGAKVFQAHPEIPDVSFSLTPDSKKLSNLYSSQPNPPNFRTGPFLYLKDKFPAAVTAVGSLYGNTVGSVESFNEQKAAMESVGYKFAYTRSYAPTETQFASDILRMRNSGVQFLFMTDTDDAAAARIVNEAYQQNWHPQVIFSESQYDSTFVKLADPKAIEGEWQEDQFALFQGEDRASVPEVDLFLTWMQKTHPGFPPDLFAMYSWTEAALFVQALKAAGANPTRVSLFDALKNIHNFDDNGMLPTTDVGAKKPPTCYQVFQRKSGAWVRVAPPDKGFLCDPGGYQYAAQ
jgi:ABC-type branched-subunit amino acid transport system substrate-binding protein